MKCIDFDSHFEAYLRQWMTDHEGDFDNMDQMELAMPQVYADFLDTPADWLDGEKPGAYFAQWQDAGHLIDWLAQYLKEGVSVPDMLLNRIAELGEPAAQLLCGMLDEHSATAERQMLAVTLLRELQSALPMQRYIDWQTVRTLEDELCDNALESLEEMGEAAVPAMLAALPGATVAGQEALLSVLSRWPGDERIYEGLTRLFEELPHRRAVLAAYLGRLGDDRALPLLMRAAEEEQLKYLDYIEIRAAIEALGGEAPEREFFEDPEYEALYGLNT